MPESSEPPFTLSTSRGVTIVHVQPREISNPDQAREFGQHLDRLLEPGGPSRFLLDFDKTKSMSSTAYAVLLTFAKKVGGAGGEVKICRMDPSVRFGADILSLGQFIEIHPDERSALDAYTR